jgi:hypothetical protein
MAAQPAMITFMDDFTTTFSPADFNLEVPAFDPLLGTLTEVLVDFSGDFDAELLLTNGSGTDGEVSGSYAANFLLSGPIPLGLLVSLSPTALLDPPVAVPASSTVGPITLGDSDSGSVTFTAPADLAAFTGVGSLLLPVMTASGPSLVANFGSFTFSGTATGNAAVSVTYTYDLGGGGPTPIPEPGTWGLIGSGVALVLLGSYRRRRTQ